MSTEDPLNQQSQHQFGQHQLDDPGLGNPYHANRLQAAYNPVGQQGYNQPYPPNQLQPAPILTRLSDEDVQRIADAVRKPLTNWPVDYWSRCRHHYFRDHADSGAWGVRDDTGDRIVATGLDKSVAAAVACLLNGHVGLARSCLDGLPE